MYSMKKFVNLTESDLHRIIKSSVKAYLKENQEIESKLHEFSDLENKSDDELEKLYGKVGKDMVYSKYRNQLMNKIFEVYPELKEKCEEKKKKKDLAV